MNSEINKLKTKCQDFELRFRLKGLHFTLDKLTEFLQTSGDNSFLAFYQNEVNHANHLKAETIRHHNNILDKLRKFGKINQFSDLYLRIYRHLTPGS